MSFKKIILENGLEIGGNRMSLEAEQGCGGVAWVSGAAKEWREVERLLCNSSWQNRDSDF